MIVELIKIKSLNVTRGGDGKLEMSGTRGKGDKDRTKGIRIEGTREAILINT